MGGDSSAEVYNSQFFDNKATMEADAEYAEFSGGGAVAVNNPQFGDVTFHGCSFMDNTDNTGHVADIFVLSGSATFVSSCPDDYEVRLVP